VQPCNGCARIGKSIERTAGLEAFQAGDAVEGFHHELMAFAEGLYHRRQAVLVAVQRGLGGDLGDRGRIGSALRLHILHCGDDGFRSGGVADAPAGHGIGFRDTVQHHGAAIQVGAGIQDIAEFLLAEQDVLVHVVAGNQDLRMFAQHLAQRFQVFQRVHCAGGIARAVEDDHARLGGDGFGQLFWCQLEALRDVGPNDDRLAFGDEDDVGIGHPVRRGDDDFVAGIDGCQNEVEEALLAAAGDQDLFGGIVQAVVALELGDDGLLQRGGATHRGVLGETLVDGRDGGILDVLRCIEIRLAGSQSDDVLAFGFQFGRTGGDGEGGRRLDGLYAR